MNTLTTYNYTTYAMVACPPDYQATHVALSTGTSTALSTGVVASFDLALGGGKRLSINTYDKTTALLQSSERMSSAGHSAYIHI